MEPRELLKRLMDEAGHNPNSLSRAVHGRTKQPQIFKFLAGTVREPKRSTWEPVAGLYKVPVEAFFNPRVADEVVKSRFGGASAPVIAAEPVASYTPDIRELVAALAITLKGLDEKRRAEAVAKLAVLGEAPDSEMLRDSLAVILSGAPSGEPSPSAKSLRRKAQR